MAATLDHHRNAAIDRQSTVGPSADSRRQSDGFRVFRGAPDTQADYRRPALYTPDERRRRDASGWTLVQGLLAPIQCLVFLVSAGLVLRYLIAGEGLAAASASVVVKTLVLYTIMITGSIWEKVVFGRWLFAPAFFWEDVFSMLVLALHTLYLVMLFGGLGSPVEQLAVALAAYASYAINAAQFILKLRAARIDSALIAQSIGSADRSVAA